MSNDPNSTFLDKCRKVDFSCESTQREENLDRLKRILANLEAENSNIERANKMKRKTGKTILVTVAAITVICLTFAVAYADELYRIIKSVTVGEHATYYVIEDNRESIPLPAGLDVQLYDENGNEASVWPVGKQLFNADGEPMTIIYNGDTPFAISAEEYRLMRETEKTNYTTFYDIPNGVKYFICDILMPTYLPEGYSFNRIEYYSNSVEELLADENIEKYMNVYYSNGKNEMYEQIRYMDAETAFASTGAADIEKININGNEAVINGNCVDIQIGDVMYMLFGNDDITANELLKIAESLAPVN